MCQVLSVSKHCSTVALALYKSFLEARPVVQGIFLLRFVAGASFAGPLFSDTWSFSLWSGAALWVCTMSSIYILNGIMDIQEDRTNCSARPVSCGDLPITWAAYIAAGLSVTSIVGSLMLVGASMTWGVMTVLALGWAYSAPPTLSETLAYRSCNGSYACGPDVLLCRIHR